MDASPIIKVLSALVAVASAQLLLSTSAIATEASTRLEVSTLLQEEIVSHWQADSSPIDVEIRQFVPPDTGGPDRSDGTGTR